MVNNECTMNIIKHWWQCENIYFLHHFERRGPKYNNNYINVKQSNIIHNYHHILWLILQEMWKNRIEHLVYDYWKFALFLNKHAQKAPAYFPFQENTLKSNENIINLKTRFFKCTSKLEGTCIGYKYLLWYHPSQKKLYKWNKHNSRMMYCEYDKCFCNFEISLPENTTFLFSVTFFIILFSVTFSFFYAQ